MSEQRARAATNSTGSTASTGSAKKITNANSGERRGGKGGGNTGENTGARTGADAAGRNWARAPLYVLLFLLGAATGLAGALVSGALVPLGTLLALLATGGLCYGGTYGLGTRSGALAPGIGWVVAVLLGSFGRTEGDSLLGGGTAGSVFLFGGIAVAVICATMPKLPQPGGPAVRPGGPAA